MKGSALMFLSKKQINIIDTVGFNLNVQAGELLGVPLKDYTSAIMDNWQSLVGHQVSQEELLEIINKGLAGSIDTIAAVFDGKSPESPKLPILEQTKLSIVQYSILQQLLNGTKRLKYEAPQFLDRQPGSCPQIGDWVGFYAKPVVSSYHLMKAEFLGVLHQRTNKPHIMHYYQVPEYWNQRLAFWVYIRKPLFYHTMNGAGFLSNSLENDYLKSKRLIIPDDYNRPIQNYQQEMPQPLNTELSFLCSEQSQRQWSDSVSYFDVLKEIHFCSHLLKFLFAGVLQKSSASFAAECLVGLKVIDQSEISRAAVLLSHINDKLNLQDKVGIDSGVHAILGLSPRFYLKLDQDTSRYFDALVANGYIPKPTVLQAIMDEFSTDKELVWQQTGSGDCRQELGFVNETISTNSMNAFFSKIK